MSKISKTIDLYSNLVLWFDTVRNTDVLVVGGKNASDGKETVTAKRKRSPKKNPKRNKIFSLIVDAGVALGVRSAVSELFRGSPWYVSFVVTWFAMALYFIAKTQD